jgi:hypothetical protein
MKTPALIVTLLLVAFAFTDVKANSQGTYSAKLISPTAGQVLYPGEQVRIEWAPSFPDMRNLHLCEMEIVLSLDGGRTFTIWITTEITPNSRYFDWIVPNAPTPAAVLDIRFGCELYYPETHSPQPASTFVIAQTAPQVH